MADEDREITLGTGKLLGFFFGLVVLCAFFFVAGFTLGRNSAPARPAAEVLPAPVPASTTVKPSPAKTALQPDCSAAPQGCPPAGSNELSFSKPADNTGATPAVAPAAPVATPSGIPTTAPDFGKQAAQSSYTVQVAAVSKQQDAEALASALRKKSYQVTVTTPVSDSLFHVQVGPFADLKEAEAMRTRLLSDGYNPIVKR